MTIRFDQLPGFKKELKRLTKKYRTLPEDLQEFQRVVSAIPLGNSKHFNVMTNTGAVQVVKARFFCRALKGSSLRVIYGYLEKRNQIDFIELYFKGDKENEDRMRIKDYISTHITSK